MVVESGKLHYAIRGRRICSIRPWAMHLKKPAEVGDGLILRSLRLKHVVYAQHSCQNSCLSAILKCNLDLGYYCRVHCSRSTTGGGSHPYTPAVLPPATKELDSVKGQDAILMPVCQHSLTM